MDLEATIDSLKRDRDSLDIAIMALERLVAANPRGPPRQAVVRMSLEMRRQMETVSSLIGPAAKTMAAGQNGSISR